MRRILFAVALGWLSVAVTGVGADEGVTEIKPLYPAQSAVSDDPNEMINDTPDLWFVEFHGSPTSEGGVLSTVLSEHAKFRNDARRAGVAFVERRAFSSLFNGLSISIDRAGLNKLTRLTSIKALYPVESIPVPELSPVLDPELATALAMTGANVAQNTLGLTGTGVRVGVIDTGVDYDHPDLGGCFGPGCRVEVGWDFVGDAYTGPGSTPVPDPDPDDCNGHGTHVTGIVGANGTVKGVAPGVVFGAYRVFGCSGSTSADIMLAAMERALADGMHIVNMSIGAAFQWPQYPTAQGADRLVNKGVVVVTSFGNSGSSGVYSGSAPGVGKKVIATASFDNTHLSLPAFTITPDDQAIGYNQAAAAPAAPTSGSFPMKRTGTATSTADACSPLPAGSLAGHVALIRRGTCSFYTKARNAELAGALAVVLYNNMAGIFSPTVAGSPAITIPVVAIQGVDGELINNRLAAGPVTMTWTSNQASVPVPTGGLISGFSSYGLAPDLSLKPDLGAPGGFIHSTIPLELGGHAVISGTSMASPHVAGAAALVLEARPKTPSNAMRTVLQNSADPRVWWGGPALGFLDNVHRQGAGMVDIPGAILSTTKIEPSKLALGESEAGPAVRTLTIENDAASDVTYDLSHVPALATGGSTFSPSFFLASATASFSASSVTVPGNGSASVDVMITAPVGPVRGQYGGYLVFSPQGGGAEYRVPYAGFVGDYQSIQVLTPTAFGLPWLSRRVGSSFLNRPAGEAYTMVGDDIPYILVHLDHQSRRLRMDVFDAVKGKAWHRALQLDHVGRNSTPTSFFALPWDGITTAGNKTYTVPNGQYVIRLTVNKALGDDSNPAHTESWTSPVITISRPGMLAGQPSAEESPELLPVTFAVSRLHANPLRVGSSLQLAIDAPGTRTVGFEMYDVSGRRVAERADEQLVGGRHRLAWNPRVEAPGLYFIRVRTDASETAKLPVVLIH